MMSCFSSAQNFSHHRVSFSSFFLKEICAVVSDGSVDFALYTENVQSTAQQMTFLKENTGVTFNELVNIKQIHGRRVLIVGKKDTGIKTRRKADGLLTSEPGVALTIRTADCIPVFIYDDKKKVIGLIHAGWRGVYKRIVPNAISIMKRKWKSQPKDLRVALGPSIQPCCYEVQKEFLKYFPKETFRRGGRLFLDLPRAVKRQLAGSGVLAKNIHDSKLCTCCDKRLFSYRRQGLKAGRMISIMMMERC